MSHNSFAVRSVAAAAILGLSLSAASIGAPLAGAQAQPATGAIITQDTGTLTIHKRSNTDAAGNIDPNFQTSDPTGNVTNPAPGQPLNGAKFKVYEIFDVTGEANNKVDLKTNQSVKDAASITKTGWVASGSNYTLTVNSKKYEARPLAANAEKETAGAGEAQWANIATGAYFVVETAVPTGYEPSAPFVAFVPMTQGNADTNQGTTWNYDVHAYPKNYKNVAVKEVKDTNKQVGQEITFSVTGAVPTNLDPTNGLTKFQFKDDLDETKVAYASTPAPFVEVLAEDGSVLGKLERSDLDVVHSGAATEELTVSLSTAGLAKFNGTYKTTGKKLRLTFAATVKAVGELKNKATVVTNNGTGAGDTTTETNETKSYWAKVKIVKEDANSTTKLQGAEFQLFGSKDNETCEPADLVDDNKVKTQTGDPATGALTDTWTTDAKGEVMINGLHVNDFNDNKAYSEPQYKAYCLVETKAPAGYELLSKPIQLKLMKTDTAAAFTASTNDPAVATTVDAPNYQLTANIKNIPDTTPQLPLTGGAGVGLLVALGALIVGTGAWFGRRASRA